MVEVDGKETLIGNEVIQLKTKNIPKGLVALERVFDGPDKANVKKTSPHKEDLEEINLGTENSPNKVYIGKKMKLHIRTMLISLLRKYRHVFFWSYDDLKAYREDLFQHEIPLKPDVKHFR